ncbi:hypothetical protein KR200_008357, partial [Drosophila serrata]
AHMESSARAPERSLRQCLAHALDGNGTRSAGCLDRLTVKGMDTFPPPSSLEAKASRCLLFEQLLKGGRRKQERLLVPDLATNWFRKQKVYVDKLSTEELADLSSGLANQNECYELQYSCDCLEEKKCSDQMRHHQNSCSCCGCPESAEAQATQNTAMASQCLPLTEPKSRNPFLLNSDATMEEKYSKCPLHPRDTNDGSGNSCQQSNDRSSYNRLLQAMDRHCPSTRRSEPIPPRLRRKYDLRHAPQRRLDPTAFRRISPEFFRILDAYETAMSESCPLYGISMHHWGNPTECCPCEEQTCTWEKQHFLGDDSVATARLSPYRLPGLNRQPEEGSEEYDMQQEEEHPEHRRSRQLSTVSNYSSTKSDLDEMRQLGFDTEEQQEYLKQQQQELEQQQKELKQQQQQLQQQHQQQLKQQQQELQKQQQQLQQQQQKLQQKLGAIQQVPKIPKKRRDWRNCFRQSPVSKYTMACVNAYTPAHPSLAPLPHCPPTPSSLTPDSSLTAASSSFTPSCSIPPAPSIPPASIPPNESCLCVPLSSSCTLPNVSNQKESFFGNLSGLCRRVNRPLYDLGTNFQQIRAKYAKKQQTKLQRRQESQAGMDHSPKLFVSVPAPCIWQKVKRQLPPDYPETEMQAEDSSTTLMPPVNESYTQSGLGGEEEDDDDDEEEEEEDEQQQQQQQKEEEQQQKEEQKDEEPEETKQEQEQQQVAEDALQAELPTIPTKEHNIQYQVPTIKAAPEESASKPPIRRKQSTESDYAKCGYRPRAFYLGNDYYQLMRRVARPRPSKERLKRKKASEQVNTRARQKPIKDQCQSRPKEQFKPNFKPLKPNAKKPCTAMASEQKSICLKSAIERPKLSSWRTVKPKKIVQRQSTKTLPEDPPPDPEDTCNCGCLDIIEKQAPIETDIPLTVFQEHTETPMNPQPSSSGFVSSQYANQEMIPSCSQPATSPSSQPATSPSSQQLTSTCSLMTTPVTCCSPMIPIRKPSSIRKCVSNTQTSTTLSLEPPMQQRSPTRKMRGRSRTPTRRRERKPCCYCQTLKRSPVAPKKQFRKRATSCGSSSSGGRTQTQRDRSSSGYRYSQSEASPALSFAPPPPPPPPQHMASGRRFYTDTQPGMAAKRKFSSRSLHTTCSIRALSSNTDSIRCPCAPAPSVASVEPPPDSFKEDPEHQQHQEHQEHQQHQQHQEHQHHQEHQQQCPAQPPPYKFKMFSNKPLLFKNTLRWEEHEHRYARTRLRTNRPTPPPRQDVYYANAIKRNQGVGWQPIEQRHNYNNHNAFYCPEENYQRWRNEPYCRQQCQPVQETLADPRTLRNQPYPNVLAYQQHINSSHVPRTEQDGAIAAAAQGLRGLVQALGGPRHRSQHEEREYSQEMMESASQSCYNGEEAMEQQENFSYRTGTSCLCSDNPNDESMTSGSTCLRGSTWSERTWSSMEASPERLRTGITAERSARERRRGPDSGALISFHSGMNFRSNPLAGQRMRCDHQRYRQAGGSSPVNQDKEELQQQPGPKPTPLAIFLDELRAKHDARQNLSRSRPNQTKPRKVEKTVETESSSSDDCADADDSLDTRRHTSKGKSMVIPATYTGLLEEQVINEYLPRPSYKRRT